MRILSLHNKRCFFSIFSHCIIGKSNRKRVKVELRAYACHGQVVSLSRLETNHSIIGPPLPPLFAPFFRSEGIAPAVRVKCRLQLYSLSQFPCLSCRRSLRLFCHYLRLVKGWNYSIVMAFSFFFQAKQIANEITGNGLFGGLGLNIV